jgi:hypothetical protein
MTHQDQTITALLANIERADAKHKPLTDSMLALGPLTAEYFEAMDEIQARDEFGTYRELIDLATVCVRRCKAILEQRAAEGHTVAGGE